MSARLNAAVERWPTLCEVKPAKRVTSDPGLTRVFCVGRKLGRPAEAGADAPVRVTSLTSFLLISCARKRGSAQESDRVRAKRPFS